jgi:hypothetical protein
MMAPASSARYTRSACSCAFASLALTASAASRRSLAIAMFAATRASNSRAEVGSITTGAEARGGGGGHGGCFGGGFYGSSFDGGMMTGRSAFVPGGNRMHLHNKCMVVMCRPPPR